MLNSLRNQLECPLLQIPPEVRNEICKLAVLSTYEDGSISFDSLGAIDAEHQLPWTHVCKQLWTETFMLPFAICAFSFGTGRDYATFVDTTSAGQRDALRELTLGLICEDGEVTWATGILDEMDDEDEDEGGDGDEDEDQGDDENETGDKDEIRLKSASPNLQRLNIENLFRETRERHCQALDCRCKEKQRGCGHQDKEGRKLVKTHGKEGLKGSV
ncbi:hypothetical protein SLS61_001967 [Didymella pomorum]